MAIRKRHRHDDPSVASDWDFENAWRRQSNRPGHLPKGCRSWLAKGLRHPPKPVKQIEKLVEKGLKIERFGAVAAAEKVLGKREARAPLTIRFRAELLDEFRDDVQQLSGLVGRDLSYWH